ncbi:MULTISPECIES: site-specific DNA-methyltransferase [Sphingomonadales]|uniref:site-specific DNA-methyltransferase (adenine-specific) n=1 Tax=Novosphingobium subterraneum TaxID=48936 RepID=A0A0B9A2U3_9SPHN|nr:MULTISPECIES: site-specific DNA-methyltransferase [Sphingomonadales]KHS49425.1 DNA methylase [Novosphingobium subterraneum]KHS49647.1 DNA methylase [Novosphingobium subterraneum]MCH2241869.1 site-specific DNA-methyltransferase [Aquabacterium sp.]
MDKMKMHSPDLSQDNIAKIRALFPDCVTEAADEQGNIRLAIDFDQLRQTLSDHIVEGPQERYRLDWPGKREALLTANAPIAKTLRPCREESVDFDTTQNLFIEGDNLDALKLLQESYLGKVKLIYIDPPYNTGKDFIYRDKFSSLKAQYENLTEQRDAEGGLLVANPETKGRYHSDWLTMIYSRLKVARNLLAEDGLIFISIDDVEQAALKQLCAEIFGEKNFIAQLTWEKGRKNDAKFFSLGHEYMLVYARNQLILRERGEIWREEKPGAKEIWDEFVRLRSIHGDNFSLMEKELGAWFAELPKSHPSKKWSRYKRIDKNGPWRDDNISWPGGDGPRYDVIHPVTKQPCAVPERGWIYSSHETMMEKIKSGIVEFRADHTDPPQRKTHIRPIPEELDDDADIFEEVDDEQGDTELATQVRPSVIYKQSQVAVKYLRSLMGGKVFNNPKDHEELAKLIVYATPRNPDAIIMDFFAGSGSTAEAVLTANATAGTNHKFVVVQLPEDLDQAASATTGAAKKTVQNAIKLLDKVGRPHLLSEVTKERIRRAGMEALKGNVSEGWNRDVGFRVLKVDSSNMSEVYYSPDEVSQDELFGQVDSVKSDRTGEDLLFQVLIDWGVELTLPINRETLHGKTVYSVDGNALIACFDTGVTDELVKEIAARAPLRAVFRDTSFARDADRINAEQLFRQLSPVTELKAI